MNIINARKTDAADLASLINIAGEGLPEYLWKDLAKPDESVQEVGLRRAQREKGGFSYTKAKIVADGNDAAAMIIAYALDDPYELDSMEEYPEPVRPLVSLEAKVPGSWYINALATKENFRGKGYATQLMEHTEQLAREEKMKSMSIIVSSENHIAKGLYLRLGFEFLSALPVIPFPGIIYGGEWQLLVKKLAA